MDGTRRSRPRSDCTVVELDGCISVHAPATDTVYMLDPRATAVWLLLNGTRTADQIALHLAQIHGSSPEVIRQDVVELIDRLAVEGVLTDGMDAHR